MANQTIGGLPDGGAVVASTMFEAEVVGTPNTSARHTAAQIATFVAAAIGRQGYRFTVDLDSTADSDPGAGLLKFNNATPASATSIYIDNSTIDGVDISAFYAALGSSGFMRVVAATDPGEWAVFRWTAVVSGSGYYKFTVTGAGSLGTLDDADEVLVVFDSDATGSVGNDSITNLQLANMAQWSLKGRVSSGTGDPEDLTFNQARQLLNKQQTLSDGATINWDADAGLNARVTLGGNRTLANPTNLVAGDVLNLRIVQDGTGSRTLAYGSKWKFPGGTVPVLSTAAGAVDFLSAQYDATADTLFAVLNKAFA